MEIIGLLPQKERSLFVVVMSDHYGKVKRATNTSKNTVIHVVNVLLDHKIVWCGIPIIILSENRPQFVIKSIETLFRLLGSTHVTTTVYHSQTKGQSKRYHKTIHDYLQHHAAGSQRDWEMYV